MLDAPVSHLYPPAADDRTMDVGEKVRQWLEQAQGKNGFHLLKTGGEALSARMAVMQLARHSLDLQYYMFQDDLTGKLIIEELLRAADRGVKIRILLDDLDFGRVKGTLGILTLHRNIRLRIFNPASTRRQRLLFRVSKWSRTLERYTKRMHNKALIADRCLGVIGGRNLGDEYFDAADEFAFSDLDVLMMGGVVDRLDACFERYWESTPAHDLANLEDVQPDLKRYMVHRIALRKYYDDVAHMKVINKVGPDGFLQSLHDGTLPFIWAEADFSADAPEKVLQPIERSESPPMKRLEELLEQAREECVIVSPYFIPAEEGMRIFKAARRRGVRIRVLTNSLASTDITAVQAVYGRYREAMLREGIEIHELKPISGKRTRSNLFRKRASRSSLHAKTYVVDREYVMIGSMNFDPRSRLRNTETVVTLRSPDMAEQVLRMFEDITDLSRSYRLCLDGQGRVEWVSRKGGREIRYFRDPKPGWWRRIWEWVFHHIAPESQL